MRPSSAALWRFEQSRSFTAGHHLVSLTSSCMGGSANSSRATAATPPSAGAKLHPPTVFHPLSRLSGRACVLGLPAFAFLRDVARRATFNKELIMKKIALFLPSWWRRWSFSLSPDQRGRKTRPAETSGHGFLQRVMMQTAAMRPRRLGLLHGDQFGDRQRRR